MHLFRAWHIVNTQEILATIVFCGWFTPQPESLAVPKFAVSFLLVHTSLPGPGMPYSFFLPLTVTIPFPSEVSSSKKIFLGVVLYHPSPPLHRHSLLELFGHTSIWNMNLITICFPNIFCCLYWTLSFVTVVRNNVQSVGFQCYHSCLEPKGFQSLNISTVISFNPHNHSMLCQHYCYYQIQKVKLDEVKKFAPGHLVSKCQKSRIPHV